jgi:succinyl-CoA synthetase alpha subunit
VDVHGNAAAVVDDGNAGVLVDRDGDLRAEAAHGLVHGVVDDLLDEVVQAVGTGGPDVHGRALSDWIEAFEDLDGTSVVAQGRIVPVPARRVRGIQLRVSRLRPVTVAARGYKNAKSA